MGRRRAKASERTKIAGRAIGGAILAGLVYDGVKAGFKWALERSPAQAKVKGLRRSVTGIEATAPEYGGAQTSRVASPDITPPESHSDVNS